MVDDGSSDETATILSSFCDHRLRVIRHSQNLGIPCARNTGLAAATGQFIAWLDSDDLARPERLITQIEFLQTHPEVAMVGCSAAKIAGDGKRLRGIRVPPLSHEAIKAWLLFRSAFQQSSIIGRASILKAVPYRSENSVCEDLDVFIRLSHNHRLANLPEVLIDRRLHDNQIIRSQTEAIRARKAILLAPALTKLGVKFSNEDLQRHVVLGNSMGAPVDADFLRWSNEWFERLRAANKETNCVDEDALNLASKFFFVKAYIALLKERPRDSLSNILIGARHFRGLISFRMLAWLVKALP